MSTFVIDLSKQIIAAEEAFAKKFGGKKRSDLKDDDFLYPATRSFPIVTEQNVRDAIDDYGRSGSTDTYEEFIHKLWRKAKSKGLEGGIPESTRKKYNLK